DLNDQERGRYDQDFRFGAANRKHAFFLFMQLEDHKYKRMKHFDAHAYRTSARADVIQFARGRMRTHNILQDKVHRFHADPVILDLLTQIHRGGGGGGGGTDARKAVPAFSPETAAKLRDRAFDRAALAARSLPYEKLDQRTMDILLGVA